jgi:glyceraldehyde 3-phosphate dehydrogenase
MMVNGLWVRFCAEDEPFPPEAVLIESTGSLSGETAAKFNREHDLRGAILAYYCSALPLIVAGLNEYRMHEIDPLVISAGSDAASACLPVLDLLEQEYQIESGHIEVIRPFTSDQNLLDNLHSTARLGRAAPANLVLSEDNLDAEIREFWPEKAISSSIVRAPVINGSLAILSLRLAVSVTPAELLQFLQTQALFGNLRNQLDLVFSEDFVSSDVRGASSCALIDANRLKANGKNIVLYLWYDNEAGYAHQLIRLLKNLDSLSVMQYS